MRHAISLMTLLPLALLTSGCRPPCARAPVFIDEVSIAALSERPLEARLSLDPNGDLPSEYRFSDLTADDLPGGLAAELARSRTRAVAVGFPMSPSAGTG